MKRFLMLVIAAFLVIHPLSAHADSIVYNWVTGFGGALQDFGFFVNSDASGNSYLASQFQGSVDLDPTSGTLNVTSAGNYDIAITKFNASGTPLWIKAFGGTGADFVYSVSPDVSGNVYIVGGFQNTVDFDPGVGVTNIASAGSNDIFILKLDSAGNFVWVKTLGSTGDDFGRSFLFDGSGGMYIAGYFSGTVDFDPGAGTTNLTSAGSTDVFILRLDSSGNFTSVKGFGGTGVDFIYGKIALDTSGNLYTAGVFQNTADFDPGAGVTNLTAAGNSDIFVAKFDSSGNLLWAKGMGGTAQDQARSLAVDTSGNVYIVGTFQSSSVDFDPGPGVYNVSLGGSQDAFILKLDSAGNFVWVGPVDSAGSDASYSVVTDSAGNVYHVGYFSNSFDADPGVGVYTVTSAGALDIFVRKIDPSGNLIWIKVLGSAGSDASYAMSADFSSNTLYLTGGFQNTVDFDPGAGTANLTSNGDYDVFFGKYTFDTTPPVINLNGSSSVNLYVGEVYSDQGATALDAIDGDVTGSIVSTGSVNTATPGVYTITYNVSDSSNNAATPVVRTITVLHRNYGHPVVQSTPPVVTSSPSTSSQGTQSKFVFTKYLSFGMRDVQVFELQKYLNTHGSPVALSGIGSLGNETNYFGLATKKALIKYQKANTITPSVGFFGSTTRAYVNRGI